MTPAIILDSLRRQNGVTLDELPVCSGLYALRDHTGSIRYIGIAHSEGFRTRIRDKHTTGSEDRSHKFSAAYNTGRLWRNRHGGFAEDAIVSKRLRTRFIRKHCTASYFEIENYADKREFEVLERGILAIAQNAESLWNRKFDAPEEPTVLVDAIIAELRMSADDCAAIDRQSIRFSERLK